MDAKGTILDRANELPHLERLLIVCGMPNAGKSTLLRSMFTDPRFGTGRTIPTSSRIPTVALSRERCLHVRCTSPHEAGETLDAFFDELHRARAAAWHLYWRFNYACAMQPHARNNAPDLVAFCQAISARLIPERIRVVQIDPRHDGTAGTMLNHAEVDILRGLDIDVVTIDARQTSTLKAPTNGLFLADFFDFT